MSNYQADWLIDDEGKVIDEDGSGNEEDEDGGDGEDNEGEEDDDVDDEEEDGDDMEQQQKEELIQVKDLSAMLPPSGLPKAYIDGVDSNLVLEEEDDDITLDGSILTVNMPTKKELQVLKFFSFTFLF